MDKQYYRAYYDLERKHWWFKARAHILASYIKKNMAANKKLKILNVGVATGASTTMLQQFGEVTSIEYEKDCIDFVKDKVDFKILEGSILELPFEADSFDLVCAFDVIEHVEDDNQAATELTRVCKASGSVLVTVPAFMMLWSDHDVVNHHFRRYTRLNFKVLFQDKGKIVFSSYFNFILSPIVYLIRTLSNLRKSETAQSDFSKFKPGLLNTLLLRIMKSESGFISRQKSYPFGVSILLHWKKNM